jgi:hypothetical protein
VVIAEENKEPSLNLCPRLNIEMISPVRGIVIEG